MRNEAVEPVPPEAMLGASDWDEEDLLTVVEASDRLAAEIKAARRRIRETEEVLADRDSSAAHASRLAGERKRLEDLIVAAERIKAAQTNGPSVNGQARIEAVVFDMGGVLTVEPFQASRDYAAELGLPADAFVDQLRGPKFHEVETGDSSVRDFLKFVCRDVRERLGVDVDIRRLAECLSAGQQVRPEMVTLVGDLARSGLKVGLLTNNAKEAKAWWTSGVLPLESFAAIVDSSEVGLRKPDPAIFALTAERIGCGPGQIVYFDDAEENVAGAAASGLAARLFSDPDACRQECAKHGLL